MVIILSGNQTLHRTRGGSLGLLTITEIAERLGVHPSAIKNWRAAPGC
jgi:transposase-like protein